MRISQKLHNIHLPNHVSTRFEKMFIYLTALSFLSIAGIYLLLI